MTRYDRENRQWIPQCPYGDVCSGCDALGYCTRAEEDYANTLAGSMENLQREVRELGRMILATFRRRRAR